ncbi:MAG: DUF4249 family protein, partial [Pricia sp.]
YISANRYSILVRQQVISSEAYSYFETLKDFSQSESLFSESQPGFINGNIRSEPDAEEKVVGYFTVASLTEKRIFFEHNDFFPDGPAPDFVNACEFDAPDYRILVEKIRSGEVKYVLPNTDPGPMEGPYLVVPDICGDCTVFGSNVVPDFWED